MQAITIKMEDRLLEELDQKLGEHRYSTRTEFIRDAIREKLSELEKEEVLKNLAQLKGSSKRKTSEKSKRLVIKKRHSKGRCFACHSCQR